MGNMALFADKSAPKIVIYGDSGVGKTELASKLAKHWNLIVLDLDNSLETYQKLPIEWQERITYIGIKEDIENPKAFATVDKILMSKLPVKYCIEHGRVDCLDCMKKGLKSEVLDLRNFDPKDTIIIVDSKTRYADSHFASATINVDFENIGEKAAFDHYGSLRQRMLNFESLVQYNRFPMCIITHTEFVESKEGNKFFPAGGTRKYASGSAKFYNTTIYMTKVNGKINACSVATGSMVSVARSRSDIEVSMDNIETFYDCFRPMEQRIVFTKERIAAILKKREDDAKQKPATPVLGKK